MADVMVFVDRAVQGDLPGVCVIDGVDTPDSLVVREEVGDGAGLGVAWLLLLVGPLGWIGLVLMSCFRSGREVLTVQLPYSAAAYGRLRAARRQGRIGRALVAAAIVTGVVLVGRDLSDPVAVLAIGAAATALVWGAVEAARGAWRIGRLTVRVELDASRRWVTLRSVHPRFVAAASPTDAMHASPNRPYTP